MKKLYTFIVLLICFEVLTAQVKNITWSEPVQTGNNTFLCGVFGQTNHSVFVFSDRETPVSAITIHVPGQKPVEHTLVSKAKNVLGAHVYGNTQIIFVDEINEKDGFFEHEVKGLVFTSNGFTEETSYIKFETRTRQHLGQARFSTSPDRTKSVLFVEAPFSSGNNEEVKLFFFDENGNIDKKNISLDLDSKQSVHNYPQLCNNSTLFFLKRDKDKNQQFRYFLYSYLPSGNNLSKKQITLPNTNISDIKGTVTNENEFLAGGFTSSDATHSYEGYYLFRFDQSCIQKSKTQGQFDETTFLRFLSKKEYSKDPSIHNYSIDNIIVSKTGKIFIAAENYTEEKNDKETLYDYKDVMLVCFNEKGEYKTTFRHQKNQQVTDAQVAWAGYKTCFTGDTLVVLHNNMVRPEGLKKSLPVLQFTGVHEKFGTKILPSFIEQPREDTPYFLPDQFYADPKGNITIVFASKETTLYRLCTLTP